jgi:hypothetical protein
LTVDDGNAVLVQTPCVTVEENLHTLLDGLDGLFLGQLGCCLFVGDCAAENGLCEMSTETGGKCRGAEGGTEKIDAGQEGLLLVIETGNEDGVPQGVEVGAALVHDFAEVCVEVLCRESGDIVGGLVVLVDAQGAEEAVEVLHVGNIATKADDGLLVKDAQTLDVGEAGEGSV